LLIGNKTEQVKLLSANASESLSVDRSRSRPPEIFLDDPAAQGFDGSGSAIDRTGQGLNRVTVSATEPKNL
jgi:hypothetical protein